MRRILRWFFRDRHTGGITVAQVPNLILWTVIVAAGLRWIWPPTSTSSSALTFILRGGLLVWATDEMLRGVNPWRRCLGAAVAAYEPATIVHAAM
jgi:hypothetical protein